jgi:hypothetical protein
MTYFEVLQQPRNIIGCVVNPESFFRMSLPTDPLCRSQRLAQQLLSTVSSGRIRRDFRVCHYLLVCPLLPPVFLYLVGKCAVSRYFEKGLVNILVPFPHGIVYIDPAVTAMYCIQALVIPPDGWMSAQAVRGVRICFPPSYFPPLVYFSGTNFLGPSHRQSSGYVLASIWIDQ